ncbi:MAG: hypothetical protein JWN25_1803 [Verrucomicrobiales bacterium]|nr:hypothetical protein [Verrucomicrobiales bacterium]
MSFLQKTKVLDDEESKPNPRASLNSVGYEVTSI